MPKGRSSKKVRSTTKPGHLKDLVAFNGEKGIKIFGRDKNEKLQHLPIKQMYHDSVNNRVHFYSPHHKTQIVVPVKTPVEVANGRAQDPKASSYYSSGSTGLTNPAARQVQTPNQLSVRSMTQTGPSMLPFATKN